MVLAYARAFGADPAEWELRWKGAAEEVAAEEAECRQAPYRGLVRFEPVDHGLFFGRDRLVEQLGDLVRGHRFTVVLGAASADQPSGGDRHSRPSGRSGGRRDAHDRSQDRHVARRRRLADRPAPRNPFRLARRRRTTRTGRLHRPRARQRRPAPSRRFRPYAAQRERPELADLGRRCSPPHRLGAAPGHTGDRGEYGRQGALHRRSRRRSPVGHLSREVDRRHGAASSVVGHAQLRFRQPRLPGEQPLQRSGGAAFPHRRAGAVPGGGGCSDEGRPERRRPPGGRLPPRRRADGPGHRPPPRPARRVAASGPKPL
ncbi:nSTAND1 domain-containing NTPase [Streptomyces geranii]|uniref:nSTAND1 domain-containing NTPase n=1 Tax=Streptomyces geranii TaxID=2058923 RepID=UPI002FCD7C1E